MENRISWSLKRSAAEWLIVHEHSSAPVDFETLK
jgi:ketosteroid isomerase-like protein